MQNSLNVNNYFNSCNGNSKDNNIEEELGDSKDNIEEELGDSIGDSIGDSNTKLIQFLRDLADDIESKKLQEEQLVKVGEFFMYFKFTEEYGTHTGTHTGTHEEQSSDEDMDIVKFISLGWYIYSHLLKDTGVYKT